MRSRWMALQLMFVLMLFSRPSSAGTREQALRLFDRLTGSPLMIEDPRLVQMEDLIREGKLREAAEIASFDNRFYNVTLKSWATVFSNREHDPFFEMNDLVAMIIGIAKDGRDARELLHGDFTYVADPALVPLAPLPQPDNNDHYRFLQTNRIDFRNALIRVEPQRADLGDPAGVLTSRAWGLAHLTAGTNRRAIEYAFLEFLCKPIKELSDPTVMDFRVRRDVDRNPGGSTVTYVNTCRGCHAGLDAIGGAYARFEFSDQVEWDFDSVQGKMTKNGNVYPQGFIPVNDGWFNFWTQNQNELLGWRTATEGSGIRAFGSMLAHSKAFSACMAKRAFAHVCHRPARDSDNNEIYQVAKRFEESGYSLRKLFEEAAILPQCLGR